MGGGGGMPFTGEDLCPGDPYTLANGDTLVLHGDTSMAAGDYQAFCGNEDPGSGNDLVYAITVPEASTISYDLTSAGVLDPVMYVREDCDVDTALWCRDFSATTRLNNRHVDPGTHYLFVDGNAGTSGEYTLTLKAVAPICGDGVVNAPAPFNEQCDDGNQTSGDGCSDACEIEPGANDSCDAPDQVIVNPGVQVVKSGSTVGNTHQHTYDETTCTVGGVDPNQPGDPNPIPDGGGPDKVFQLQPTASGTMTIRLGYDAAGTTAECDIDFGGPACWDRVLHVRHSEGALGPTICRGGEDISDTDPANWIPPTNQIACDIYGNAANGYTQEVTFDVENGETYYVFISGYYQPSVYNSGPYNLHIDLVAQ